MILTGLVTMHCAACWLAWCSYWSELCAQGVGQ